MFKSGLTAIRQNENLVLNAEQNVYVNGEIAQYLLNHQVNGVRYLYRNHQKQCSSILNDESGSGKCFQCIAFFDAILRTAEPLRILIICHRKQNLEHWQFHVDCFLVNVNTVVADNQKESQSDVPSNRITITSLDYVLNNLSKFTADKYDCLVFQDQNLETSAQSFTHLKEIKTNYTIALCSHDLMSQLPYFYELQIFCEQRTPLKQSNKSNVILKLDEFKSKFGCEEDKSLSKRNQAFRQLILLKACNDFYLRRVCSQLGSQFPPISAEDFRSNFDAWKTITCDTVPLDACDTVPLDASLNDDDLSPIELIPAANNRSFNSTNHDEVSLLNVACADFSEFDTQMSPLIYSDSDSSLAETERPDNENKNNNADGNDYNIESSPSINSQRLTPEIVCNQEHAAKTCAATKESDPTTSKSTTPVKRMNRMLQNKISPASKRLNYKQLSIEIKSHSRGQFNSPSKKCLFRTKKQSCTSTQTTENESQKNIPNSRHRSTSSTSDVQIISQNNEVLSPITLSSSSSEGLSRIPDTNETLNQNTEAEAAQETICQSPDLFDSFVSKSESVSNRSVANGQKSPTKLNTTDVETFRDVFGEPDECDDIDLLSNTNVDIFEITKNSVFDNVLCSASDRITPFKGVKSPAAEGTSKQNVSCLSGLRVILPKVNGDDVQKSQENLTQPPIDSQSSDDVVDLTANDSQKIIEISSEDSFREVEKTPERKRELTPSTRSCLKRHSNDKSVTDEKRRTPFSRLGWLTTVRTSPKSDTPQSRRRFDKWKQRTDTNNMKTDDNPKITKPRNLFKEFKSKSRSKDNPNERHNIPSTSTAKSPNIFSDHE